MTTWVALVRGVGPVSHKKMSMADLRSAASDAGLSEPRTLLATGNLIFESDGNEAGLRATLETAIAEFGLSLPVLLRPASDLPAIRDANPFPDAARDRPSKLLVAFLDRSPSGLPPPPGGERLAQTGREVYVDYPDGAGASKLAPGILDRKLGVVGTTRNWNTLLKLIRATT